jgi:bifunctional non-homologous end joining protein LigD
MSDIKIGKRSIELSNTDKVFFPDSGITKGELIEYYQRIADTMLPHLRERPLTMHRFPDGIDGEGFYQKELPDYFPGWAERAEMAKEGGKTTYLLCNNAATLVYLANQACITPHIWLSRADKPEHPDTIIFDLDPPDDDFSPVKRAALELRDLLSELGLAPFVKTSGSKGLHVVVPVDRSLDYDRVRPFARDVAVLLAGRLPDLVTTEQRKVKRQKKVYADTFRNSYAQTAVAPYAVRALPGAPVATPLEWDELKQYDTGPQYTIENIFRRLSQRGDPWSDITRHARGLEKLQQNLAKMKEEK